jgi:carboxylesterase type B
MCLISSRQPNEVFIKQLVIRRVLIGHPPVWFYIQGGGYSFNGDANDSGEQVILKSGGNLVFVGINYRVGHLDFLPLKRCGGMAT